MLGPAVNAAVIIVASLLGCYFIRGIPSRFEEMIKKGIGLSIIYVGIKGALENERVLLLIMSMVAGAVIGELINIDGLMNRLGRWAEARLLSAGKGRGSGAGNVPGNTEPHGDAPKSAGAKNFSKGFVTASILFCSGSMAIVGSMQSGLAGNHEILFAKSILDGAISLVFASSLGIGVLFSAVPVFVYQSAIALASRAVRDFLTPQVIREMSAVGSLIVAAIGFNFLISGEKEIRVANFIPAMFIPLVYLSLEAVFRA